MSAFTKICCTGTVAWTSWPVIQFNTPLYHFIPGSNHHRERAERERKRKREGEGQRERVRVSEDHWRAVKLATPLPSSMEAEEEW